MQGVPWTGPMGCLLEPSSKQGARGWSGVMAACSAHARMALCAESCTQGRFVGLIWTSFGSSVPGCSCMGCTCSIHPDWLISVRMPYTGHGDIVSMCYMQRTSLRRTGITMGWTEGLAPWAGSSLRAVFDTPDLNLYRKVGALMDFFRDSNRVE